MHRLYNVRMYFLFLTILWHFSLSAKCCSLAQNGYHLGVNKESKSHIQSFYFIVIK